MTELNNETFEISFDELDQVTGGASNQADAWGAFALQLFGFGTGHINYKFARGTLGPGLHS